MAKRVIKESGMTARQEATYDLICRNSAFGLPTPIQEIVDNYPRHQYKDGYFLNTDPRTHHPCISVYTDIDEINTNLNIPCPILWDDDHNYWVANDLQEVKAFCKPLYERQGKKKLWKQGVLMLKARRNGQMLLPFTTEEDKREYWRAFIEDIKEDLVEELVKGEE